MIAYEKPEITPLGDAAQVVQGGVINPPDGGNPDQGLNTLFELED